VEFRPCNQGDIVFELSIRMTLAEWHRLREQLETCRAGGPLHYSPAGRLRTQIINISRQAERYWTQEVKDEGLDGHRRSPE
jgi:hypothetical protein